MGQVNLIKNKKAISEILSYVLLVVLVISLGSGMYFWITSQATFPENTECPSETSLVLKEYSCIRNNNQYRLSLKLENNGNFNISYVDISFKQNNTTGLFINKSTSSNPDITKLQTLDSFPIGSIVESDVDYPSISGSDNLLQIDIVPIKGINQQRVACINSRIIIENPVCETNSGRGMS